MAKTLFDQLRMDFRAAARNLAKYPVACAVAIISLAAGIGCTTATLTIRNAIFYNPPPLLRNPQELSIVGIATPDRPQRAGVPPDVFLSWKQESALALGMAARTAEESKEVRTDSKTESIPVQAVTAELFSLLGVEPFAGRAFSAADSRQDAAAAAVLSYPAWERLFEQNPGAIGSEIRIDQQRYTVIGVMPRLYRSHRGVWIPLTDAALRNSDELEVVVRRRPQVSQTALEPALQDRLRQYSAGQPENRRNARVQFGTLRGTPLGQQISPAVVWILGACVALTLLISCTNVAVLMIAQWTAREREIAIRASLGATRWRVIRLLLSESILLALAGGILGVAATFALVGLMISRGPADLPFNLAIETRVLAQSIVMTWLAGILAGIAPALFETRRLHANPLRLMPADRVRQRWRNALVVLEITVTIALLVVTGSMIDGYKRTLSWDFKFDPAPLVAARVPATASVSPSEIRERLSRLPGVSGVARATAIPMFASGNMQRVSLDRAGDGFNALRSFISANFFATLGVPLKYGRAFAVSEETATDAKVAIVNETLAARLWPGRTAIGEVIRTEAAAFEVVGVVADYTENPLGRTRPSIYLPLSLRGPDAANNVFLIATTSASVPVAQSVRVELQQGSRESTVRTLQSNVEASAREIGVTVFPMTPLIATGMLLTAAGIYGILAFAITRRAKELALRIAIGATTGDLLTLVGKLTIRLVGCGLLLGVGLTFGLTRLVQGVGGVFDSPRWPVFVMPVFIILGIALLAAWVPSRRAVSVDPASLLRTE
jgi:predicted permease